MDFFGDGKLEGDSSENSGSSFPSLGDCFAALKPVTSPQFGSSSVLVLGEGTATALPCLTVDFLSPAVEGGTGDASDMPPSLGDTLAPLQHVTLFSSPSGDDRNAKSVFQDTVVDKGVKDILDELSKRRGKQLSQMTDFSGRNPIECLKQLLRVLEGLDVMLPRNLGACLLDQFLVSSCTDASLLTSLLACLPRESLVRNAGEEQPQGDELEQLQSLGPLKDIVVQEQFDDLGDHREEPFPDILRGERDVLYDPIGSLCRAYPDLGICVVERLGPKSIHCHRAVSSMFVDDRVEAYCRFPWSTLFWAQNPQVRIEQWPRFLTALNLCRETVLEANISDELKSLAIIRLAGAVLRTIRKCVSSFGEQKSLLIELVQSLPSWACEHLREHCGMVLSLAMEHGPECVQLITKSPLLDPTRLGKEQFAGAMRQGYQDVAVMALGNLPVVSLLEKTADGSIPLLYAVSSVDTSEYSWVLEIFEGKSSGFPLSESLIESIRIHSDSFSVVCRMAARVNNSDFLARLLNIATSLELSLTPDLLEVTWSWACLVNVYEAIFAYLRNYPLRTGGPHSLLAELLRNRHLDRARALFRIAGREYALAHQPIAEIVSGLVPRTHQVGQIMEFFIENCEPGDFAVLGSFGDNILHALAAKLPEQSFLIGYCDHIRTLVSDSFTTQRNDFGNLPCDVFRVASESAYKEIEVPAIFAPVTFAKRAA